MIAGMARLISQTTSDEATTGEGSMLTNPNNDVATAPLVRISVKAKLGIIEVIKNTMAIRTAEV
jgi:hypothetical protein